MILWKLYFWLFLTFFCIDFLRIIQKIIGAKSMTRHRNKFIGSLLLMPLLISSYLWAYNRVWLHNLFWKFYFFFVIGLVLYRISIEKPSSAKKELKYELMENPSDFYIGVGLFATAFSPAFIALFLYAFFR